MSTNNFWDSSAIYLTNCPHSGRLAPGEGYAQSSNVSLPIGTNGLFYFLVRCDIYNQVFEAAFEDNNTMATANPTIIALTPPPDLVATITQCPAVALASHTLTVGYNVANLGWSVTPNSRLGGRTVHFQQRHL